MSRIVICLAVAILLSGACNSRESGIDAATERGKEEKDSFSVLAVQPHHSIQDMESNYVTSWMEEQTNIHIDWQLIPVEDAEIKIDMLFASGEPLPDALFFGETGAVSQARVSEYASNGLIIPIQEYIDRFGPRMLELFERYPGSRDWITQEDGNIYGFGDFGRCPHCEYSQKMWINIDWLDVLSLPMPTTIDEFYSVLRAFKNEDPNGNGLADEIPLTGGKDEGGSVRDWHVNIDGFLMNPFIYNDSENRIVVDGDRVYPTYNQVGWRRGLEFLRKLYSEGLLDAEAFIQRSERARFNVEGEVNRVGSAPGGTPSFFSSPTGTATRSYRVLPPLRGENNESLSAYYPSIGINTSAQFLITRGASDPGMIITWLDFGLTQEANFTRLRGEQGVDWRYAHAGEVGINGEPAVWKDKLGVDIETSQNKTWHGFPLAEWGEAEGLGLVADPEDPWEIEGRLFRATLPYIGHGPERVASLLRIPLSDSAEYERIRVLLNGYVENWIARFVTGASDLDEDWDAYLSGLESLGLDSYMSIVADAVSQKYGEKISYVNQYMEE